MSDLNQHYLTPEFFTQVSESIKSVFDITSRIDERVKIIMEKQADVDRRLITVMDTVNNLHSRISILEAKDERSIKETLEKNSAKIAELEKDVEIMQLRAEGSEGKWRQIISFGIQLALAIVTAYVALRLGLKP